MSLEGLQLGKYRLSRLIGSGGMGDVYIGEDAGIGRQVAVKVMRAEPSSYPDEDALKHGERLFQREMRAIAMLDHPHILPLYDYGEELLYKTTLMYMVMPFRQEGSLADWLRQRAGLLSLQEVVYFLSQAAEALQHAHDHQIIHQDVKPSNFLIRRKRASASLPDLLLADFGIARISSLTSSVSHSSRGTPTYMAPEQWSGDPVPATDQYALAIMTYELLTGRPPFRGRPEQMMFMHFNSPPSPPSTFNTKLPAGVDAVILRALSKKPEERFSTISDFAIALQQAVQRRGDLYATLAISSVEALTGTTRELMLPAGRKAQVTIPLGVREGQVLSLEGLGEPYYDQGPSGRLILTVTIPPVQETVIAKGTAYEETIAASSVSVPQVPNSTASVGKALDDVQAGKMKPSPEISNKNVASQPAQKTKEEYIDEGDKFYSMRRYQQALAAYEKGLQLVPGDSILRAKYEKVCKYLKVAPAKQFPRVSPIDIKHEPDQKTKEQWLDEGDKLYSTRRYQQALAAYEQGLRLFPHDPVLRARYDGVRNYLKLPTRRSAPVSNVNSEKTARIIVIVPVIIALFLMINISTGWNIAAVVLTALIGIALFILFIT